MTAEALLARILKQDFFSGWRTAVPFILFALIWGELLGVLPVAKPAPAFGGELQNEQPRQALDDRAVEISPADAAARIAKERADAQSQSLKGLEVEVRRKAEQEAAETADADARKRQQAEELARRKAESDKIISEELENLKKAREEADRAKAAKRKAETPDSERAQMTAKRASRTKAASATGVHGRCASGRVVYRKGRRWYVTGADDTLWQNRQKVLWFGVGLSAHLPRQSEEACEPEHRPALPGPAPARARLILGGCFPQTTPKGYCASTRAAGTGGSRPARPLRSVPAPSRPACN